MEDIKSHVVGPDVQVTYDCNIREQVGIVAYATRMDGSSEKVFEAHRQRRKLFSNPRNLVSQRVRRALQCGVTPAPARRCPGASRRPTLHQDGSAAEASRLRRCAARNEHIFVVTGRMR